jgi:hypothetical protein
MTFIPLNAASFSKIFMDAIHQYHEIDAIDQPLPEYAAGQDFSNKLFLKAWIDTVQWHLEDWIRDPEIAPNIALNIKRRIDRSNQDRTDLVEWIDQHLYDELQLNMHERKNIPVNTESPGWAIDRLSILQLKRYHMRLQQEEALKNNHITTEWTTKLDRLDWQHEWLCNAIDTLLEDLKKGNRKIIPFQQMKMYNDARTNPFLTSKKQS